jgi:DNA repair protein RecN (Recombination protein N)
LIERFYLKENLSFSEVDLEFKNGLVVFSGASGSGKSVLFDAILSIFGLSNPKSLMSELCLDTTLDLSEFGIETVDDLTIFKQIKKEKNRYFINNQFVSKNVITSISKKFIKFLNLKDFSDFSNDKLLELIDNIIISYDEKFKNLINEYKENFNNFYKLKQELSQIISQEKNGNRTM